MDFTPPKMVGSICNSLSKMSNPHIVKLCDTCSTPYVRCCCIMLNKYIIRVYVFKRLVHMYLTIFGGAQYMSEVRIPM